MIFHIAKRELYDNMNSLRFRPNGVADSHADDCECRQTPGRLSFGDEHLPEECCSIPRPSAVKI